MKILVTGGAGFIGSHLTDKLIQKNHQVFVVDNLSSGKKENLNPKAKFYKLDIQNPNLRRIFKKEKPEVIFHLAAQVNLRKSISNPLFDARINILSSLNLLENSVKAKVKKFIFTSTGGAIYGEANQIPTKEGCKAKPISPYGVAKLSLEHYLYYYHEVYKLPYLILRLANVYGERQDPFGEAGVVAIFTHQLLNSRTPTINGSGQQTRDFVYVQDVVDACLKALNNKKSGIYNIGTGKETSVNKLYAELLKIIGTNIKPKYGPKIKGELIRSWLDISKAKKDLKWRSKTNLIQGLKKTVDWFKIK